MSYQNSILQEILNTQHLILQSIDNMEESSKKIISLLDTIELDMTSCNQSELYNNSCIQKKIKKKSAKNPSQKS